MAEVKVIKVKDLKEVWNSIDSIVERRQPGSFYVSDVRVINRVDLKSRMIREMENRRKSVIIFGSDEIKDRVFSNFSIFPTVGDTYKAEYKIDPITESHEGTCYLMLDVVNPNLVKFIKEKYFADINMNFIVFIPDDGLVWANY